MIGRFSDGNAARMRPAEAGGAGYDESQRRLLGAVGAFLAEHRLAPTPANYMIGYATVTAPDGEIGRAVTIATDGAIRLAQADADSIHARLAGGRSGPKPAEDGSIAHASSLVADLVRSIDEARTRFERYAGIVDTSRQDAEAYGNALVNEAATLSPATQTSGAKTVAALLALTETMIDKTRRAEEQLRAASAEMDDLRANLAAARQDAETDPLTGLPNRRAFEACFAECVNAARPRRVSLALCDIDLFKGVNDRHGHDVGDRVIRLVAKELAQGCDGSVVARYGGEEFVILFEGMDADTATAILDRTREALSRRTFKVAGTGEVLEHLSFSGGVIAVSPSEECRDAMCRADAALYRAKQNGRNRLERGD